MLNSLPEYRGAWEVQELQQQLVGPQHFAPAVQKSLLVLQGVRYWSGTCSHVRAAKAFTDTRMAETTRMWDLLVASSL